MTDIEKKVDTIIDEVISLKVEMGRLTTALKGYNGDGLLILFQRHCDQGDKHWEDYLKFKRYCIGIFFFLVGSGSLGFGVVKLAEVLSAG